MRIVKPNPNYQTVERDLKAVAQLTGYHGYAAGNELYSSDVAKIKLVFKGHATELHTNETIFCTNSDVAIKELRYTDRKTAYFSHLLMLLDLGEEGKCWATPCEDYNFQIGYEFNVENHNHLL